MGYPKSLTSQIYVVWRLLRDPNEKILVMSAGGSRAVNFTQFVQKLIATLPVTKHMTPRMNRERTSSQSFDVAGAEPSDSPSVYAVGVGNQITGMRASLVVYDDIETSQNAGSVVQREKVDHYASEAANILMSGKDETICLCTPHSMDSIYMDWIQNRGFKHLVIPAEYPDSLEPYMGGLAPYIADKLKANESLVGLPIDERMNAEFLRSKMMRIGKSQYKLQYMLDVSMSDELKHPLKLSDLIVMDVDSDFCPAKISHSSMRENIVNVKHNGFKQDRLYAPSYISDEKIAYGYRAMSIDPSGYGKDETGISVGFSAGGRIHIKKITSVAGGYGSDTMMQIANMCNDYNIGYIIVESNFGDGAFAKTLEPILARVSPITSIEPVRAKGQKELRIISTIEPLVNQHKLVFDKKIFDDDLLSKSINNSFTYQFTHITREPNCLAHDDKIDSLEMLCKFFIEREDFDENRAYESIEKERLEEDISKSLKMFRMDIPKRNFASRF